MAAAAAAGAPAAQGDRRPAQLQPARAATEHLCRLLRGHGVEGLSPELVRQAKFDHAGAREPLLQSLHDLALCVAAGLPGGCGEGVRALRHARALEAASVVGEAVPPEGRLVISHLLLGWGCPRGLVAQLLLPGGPGSRASLLALAWLVAHARLYDREMGRLRLPAALLPMLPPFPEDTSTTPEAQARRAAEAAAARRHAERVQQLLERKASGSASGADGGGDEDARWPAVHAAAQQLLSTYRSALLRLQLLTSLQEGRERLLDRVRQLQQGPGARRPRQQQPQRLEPAALTAFELHLLADLPLLGRYEQAMQQACGLLQQQLQCADAAQTFFSWMGSVLEQQQQQQQQQPAAAAAADDVLPLLQQLPAAGAPLAPQLLQRVAQQLQQAASQAGVSGGRPGGRAGAGAAPGGLADRAAALALDEAAAASGDRGGAFAAAAAAAMLAHGDVPCDQPELLAVPGDLQQRLNAQQQQQQQEPCEPRQAPLGSAWRRLHLPSEQPQPPPMGSHGSQAAGGSAAALAPVQEQLQLLHDLALHVAKTLARTRAANKQHLQAAANVLLGAGASAEALSGARVLVCSSGSRSDSQKR